jgi:TonB family protein
MYKPRLIALICLSALCAAVVGAQSPDNQMSVATAGILSAPMPSAGDVATLEAKVAGNPKDVDSRLALLRAYMAARLGAHGGDPVYRLARLGHIIYLIDQCPELPALGSPLVYVPRSGWPYGDEGDHAEVRNRWLAAAQAHFPESAVVVNAVRFLTMEDRSDAEELLVRSMIANPESRELAANLGFLYALDILGLDSMQPGARHVEQAPDRMAKAKVALDETSNAVVLAAAGTAIPNLAMAAGGGGAVDPALFELASRLSAKARLLAPEDEDIRGPMPLIRFFQAAREPVGGSAPAVLPGPGLSEAPARIQVGGVVQAARLVSKVDPVYPDEARRLGIAGDVHLRAVVSREGTVASLKLVSGHPLLVTPAIDAVRGWVYRPTLLNGAPVEVITDIVVSFPAN